MLKIVLYLVSALLILVGLFGLQRSIAWDNCLDERPRDFAVGALFLILGTVLLRVTLEI